MSKVRQISSQKKKKNRSFYFHKMENTKIAIIIFYACHLSNHTVDRFHYSQKGHNISYTCVLVDRNMAVCLISRNTNNFTKESKCVILDRFKRYRISQIRYNYQENVSEHVCLIFYNIVTDSVLTGYLNLECSQQN